MSSKHHPGQILGYATKNGVGASPQNQYMAASGTSAFADQTRLDMNQKSMIQSLITGMEDLNHFVNKENKIDPNVQITKTFDPIKKEWVLEQKNSGNNFENQSVRSDVNY